MSESEAVYPKSEHFDSAADEPVYCSSVQPHGMMFILNAADLKVLQVSTNTIDSFKILSSGLPTFLPQLFDQESVEQIQLLQSEPDLLRDNQPNLLRLSRSLGQQWFDGLLHCQGQTLLLELEPLEPESEPHWFNLQLQLQKAITRLQKVGELKDFLQLAAAEVQAISGFDRVMIYQFDAQNAGEVVAEAKRQDLFPYLGLHYPASDIPPQPRQLYAKGLLRYIPDLTAPNVELVPIQPLLPHPPPDFSFVRLRGTDPCCVQYHHNMGVAAMMVIALIKDQRLWGLISCHHQTPKRVPASVRSSCELMGRFIASELANKVNSEELEDMMRLKLLQSEFVASIAQAEDLKAALTHPAPRLLDLVSAQGVAVCLEDEMTLIGATPTIEQVEALMQWVNEQTDEFLFHTDSLPKHYLPALEYKETASGLLLLRISPMRRYSILWFRPEVLQTITWAGDPQASRQVTPDGQTVLSPRRSFEQWQETVRLTSLPWKASELENAKDLRSAIVGIVLTKADELAHMNRELERSNRELESFAYAASHDLKEPLRGIHNYATFLMEDYAELLDEAGIDRLQTLVKLTQRMESLIDVLLKFSQLGQAELQRQPTDLNALLKQVIRVFRISQPQATIEVRIPRPLPTVNSDPVLVSEVFSNLLSNAQKYNDKANPWVEVGYFQADELAATQPNLTRAQPLNRLVFYVRDNGIGIRERHLETIFRLFKRLHPQTMYGGGTGAGLTIAKKIVERHGGQIWVESLPAEGSTFYLTLE
jgi:light-regulated signal transduction histidine kinase (bacteriophytochrome)